MINKSKKDLAHSLRNKFCLEIEFVSVHSPYVLVEMMAERAYVELDHRNAYQHIAREQRRTWGRYNSPHNSKERDWGHTICSPVIVNTYELLEIEEVMSGLYSINKGITVIDLKKEVTINVIFLEEEHQESDNIWIRGIKPELQKVNKSFKAINVTSLSVSFNKLVMEDMDELRNTILLLDEVITKKRSETITSKTCYNLYDYTTNSILQVFLEKKHYKYTEETITQQVLIEASPTSGDCKVRLIRNRDVSTINNISSYTGVS